ncbi:hypothetical protein [Sphingomonas sp. PWP1-2]|uniref:hypothetical protein n=1 Tax=Sphingomonas sp. PWP1-2 TaxID=2804558 RepID=UPI003CE9C633
MDWLIAGPGESVFKGFGGPPSIPDAAPVRTDRDVFNAAEFILDMSGRAFARAAAAHTGRAETEFWEILLDYPAHAVGQVLSAAGWKQLAHDLRLNDEAPFPVVTH